MQFRKEKEKTSYSMDLCSLAFAQLVGVSLLCTSLSGLAVVYTSSCSCTIRVMHVTFPFATVHLVQHLFLMILNRIASIEKKEFQFCEHQRIDTVLQSIKLDDLGPMKTNCLLTRADRISLEFSFKKIPATLLV